MKNRIEMIEVSIISSPKSGHSPSWFLCVFISFSRASSLHKASYHCRQICVFIIKSIINREEKKSLLCKISHFLSSSLFEEKTKPKTNIGAKYLKKSSLWSDLRLHMYPLNNYCWQDSNKDWFGLSQCNRTLWLRI